MAYIYRYHFKSSSVRKKENLLNYSNNLEKYLKSFFNENYKKSKIEKEYFEFRTFNKLKSKDLQEMGRIISPIVNGNVNGGFIKSNRLMLLLSIGCNSSALCCEVPSFSSRIVSSEAYGSSSLRIYFALSTSL